jgi:MYXO-CTERM domain-containing protein
MFITNHVLAGTLAGSALRRRPVLAFAAGFATHVAMDMTPHWGNPTLDRDGFFAVAKRDGILGLGVLALVAVAGVPPRTALLAGIAGAAVLDADKPAEYLLGINPFPGWLNEFHKRIQRESPEGIRTEVVTGLGLAAVCAGVLVRRRRSYARRA